MNYDERIKKITDEYNQRVDELNEKERIRLEETQKKATREIRNAALWVLTASIAGLVVIHLLEKMFK